MLAVPATACDELDVVVDCSSGTYIRALARDLGAGLGVGGHLTALRRTRVGPFDVADAGELEDPLRAPQPRRTSQARCSPCSRSTRRAADRDCSRASACRPRSADAPVVAAIGGDGALIGLVEVRAGRTRVLMNLPTEGTAA